MTHYIIEQTRTGVILFDGDAADMQDALDQMAREAGYEDYSSVPEEIGGGDTLSVKEGMAMSPQAFTAWTDHMKRQWGWSNAECARRLGCSVNSITAWRENGAPVYVALACAALANSLPAWKAA